MPSISTPLTDAEPDQPGRRGPGRARRRAKRGAAAAVDQVAEQAPGTGRRGRRGAAAARTFAGADYAADHGSDGGVGANLTDNPEEQEQNLFTAKTVRKQGRAARRERKKRALSTMAHGFPSIDSMKSVLQFLSVPALLVFAITVTGGHWPKAVLYPLAMLMGLYVLWSAFKSTELVLAVMLMYLPFSPVYVIPLAPGLNGTNALILLGLLSTVVVSRNNNMAWIHWPAGTTTVFIFAVITCLSAITILFQTDGFSYLVHSQFDALKGWIEQFIVYFIALSTIRNHDSAKRVFIYMCIGSVIVVLYSVPEMIDKMGRSSIEKSRITGPLMQSNDFGGFVAYTLMLPGAIFLAYFSNVRAWILTPYFIIALKVLISTFSRGAYLAMALGGFLSAYYKGKGFLIFWATVGICALLLFPQFIPDSIKLRMQSVFAEQEATAGPAQLDKSSENRLILWKAAGDMILESPLQGKGFKGFAKLKAEYTERPVEESDPHNFYLYLAAQMGLPAVSFFLLILLFAFHSGRVLSRNKEDIFIRAVGIAGASATATYAAICVFGSRAVSPEYTGYFWVLLACLQVLRSDNNVAQNRRGKKKRGAQPASMQDDETALVASGTSAVAADDEAFAAPASSVNSPRMARKRSRRRASAFDQIADQD